MRFEVIQDTDLISVLDTETGWVWQPFPNAASAARFGIRLLLCRTDQERRSLKLPCPRCGKVTCICNESEDDDG